MFDLIPPNVFQMFTVFYKEKTNVKFLSSSMFIGTCKMLISYIQHKKGPIICIRPDKIPFLNNMNSNFHGSYLTWCFLVFEATLFIFRKLS